MADTPIRISLATQPDNRGWGASATAKDAKLVNAYVEAAISGPVVRGRPAFIRRGKVGTAGQGIFRKTRPYVYAISSGTLYKAVEAATLSFTSVGSVLAGTNYNFVPCNIPGSNQLFIWSPGISYVLNESSFALTQPSGANWTPFIVGACFLDGTTYALTSGGVIHGSDYNTPLTWSDTTNQILFFDLPVGMLQLGNYIFVFGAYSYDVYWDAGNPTGSPLQILQAAHQDIGAMSGTVAQVGNNICWVGRQGTGGLQVFVISGLEATKISTPAIERLINKFDGQNVYGYSAVFEGHSCYVVTCPAGTDSSISLVFDLASKAWYQWTWNNGMPLHFQLSTPAQKTNADGTFTETSYFIEAETGEIYALDSTQYIDDDGQFSIDIVTPNVDAAQLFMKTQGRVDVVCDQTDGGILHLRWSDDDYQTWSAFEELDMGAAAPWKVGMGTFRRRAFHLQFSQNLPFRAQALDLYLDKGTS